MPDPISSSSSCVAPDLACTADGDSPLSSGSSALSPAASPAPNACLPPDAPAAPATSTAASALAQKFLSNDPGAFIAASSAPSPSAGPSPSAAPPTRSAALPPRPGDQINWQVGDPRLEGHTTLAGVHLTGAVDTPNLSAHLGSQNADGSQGENIGLTATLIGGELTAEYKGWSLTLGVSSSQGGGISSGDGRDIDGDGVRERCFQMSLGPFTLGECDEL